MIYVNPGTDDDGYVPPAWRIGLSEWAWEGGQGEWVYVGHVGTGPDDPDQVWAFRCGESEQVKYRLWAQQRRDVIVHEYREAEGHDADS